jgi:hypothetical protein
MHDGKVEAEKAINFWERQYYQALERKFGGFLARALSESAHAANSASPKRPCLFTGCHR